MENRKIIKKMKEALEPLFLLIGTLLLVIFVFFAPTKYFGFDWLDFNKKQIIKVNKDEIWIYKFEAWMNKLNSIVNSKPVTEQNIQQK